MLASDYLDTFVAQRAAFESENRISVAMVRRSKHLRLSAYDSALFTSLLLYGNAFEIKMDNFGSFRVLTPLAVHTDLSQPLPTRYALYSASPDSFAAKVQGKTFGKFTHYRCALFDDQTYLNTGGRPAIVFTDKRDAYNGSELWERDVAMTAADIEAGVYDWVWQRRDEGVCIVEPWKAEIYPVSRVNYSKVLR